MEAPAAGGRPTVVLTRGAGGKLCARRAPAPGRAGSVCFEGTSERLRANGTLTGRHPGQPPGSLRSIVRQGRSCARAGSARDGRGPVPRLAPNRRQKLARLQHFWRAVRGRSPVPNRCGRPAGSRRSHAPMLATKDPSLQDLFYGSDGTRTRDLRRDRPVLVSPGWAGIGGDRLGEQGISLMILRGLPGSGGSFRRPPAGCTRDEMLSNIATPR